MKQALANGTHVIVDRYAFSGVAFSAAKPGIDFDWCRQPDRGLPRPDLVCLLDVSGEEAKKRGGYGDERYEREEFQVFIIASKTFETCLHYKFVNVARKIHAIHCIHF